MEILLSSAAWLGALGIFLLRVLNMTLATLRFLLTIRGKKAISWILGFAESALFVLVIGSVLNDLNNPLNIIAYAAGFATGNIVGMTIESRLAIGFAHLNIISTQRGQAVAEKLREASYAVTEIPARGMNGMVSLLACSLRRKDIKDAEKLILDVDPKAFITVEDITPVRRGFWRS